MQNVKYKIADMSDIDAMIDVGDDIFDAEIKKDRAIEFINDERHHLYLAYLNGDIVGMVSAINYVHPDKEPAMFILEAGVLEEHQNQGIGRTLIKEMVAFGKELGCEEIWVATEQSNLPARKAYVAAGAIEDKEPSVLLTFESNEHS